MTKTLPVLLALEILVLIVSEPVVSVPFLECVSVHWMSGDVVIKDGLLLDLIKIIKSVSVSGILAMNRYERLRKISS